MNLAVITWLWGNRFSNTDVEKLYSGLKKYLNSQFQFYCITDKTFNFIQNGISYIKAPEKHFDVYNLRCYRRLELFNPEYGLKFGERILQLDIDIAIVGDVTSLFNIRDDFKIWECRSRGKYHGKSDRVKNPSVMLFNPEFTKPFYNFFMVKSKRMIAKAKKRFQGSDQGLISYYFKNCPTWGENDGIYAYRDSAAVKNMTLPENAKIISFHGPSMCKSKMNVFNKLRG